MSEYGLTHSNPFSGTFIPIVGKVTVRPPVPCDAIRTVQATCLMMDDEKRLLIALD